MAYNLDRAIGCRIGYNGVIKAVRFVDLPAFLQRPRSICGRSSRKSTARKCIPTIAARKRARLRLVK